MDSPKCTVTYLLWIQLKFPDKEPKPKKISLYSIDEFDESIDSIGSTVLPLSIISRTEDILSSLY